MINQQAIPQLTSAGAGAVDAYLLTSERGSLSTSQLTSSAPIHFLYNPERISKAISPNYANGETMAAEMPRKEFVNTNAPTLDLSGLVLDSHNEGLTIQPWLTQLTSLVKSADGLPPPPVTFVWGAYRFGPAVLTSISWEETSWLGGLPSGATLSLSLERIPAPVSPAANVEPQPTSLTPRQQAEGTEAVRSQLTSSNDTRSRSIVQRLRAGVEDVTVINSGNILLTSSQEIIGQYDGYEVTFND